MYHMSLAAQGPGRAPRRWRFVMPVQAGLASLTRGEISTFPDTLTTQGLSLWSLNIVLTVQ